MSNQKKKNDSYLSWHVKVINTLSREKLEFLKSQNFIYLSSRQEIPKLKDIFTFNVLFSSTVPQTTLGRLSKFIHIEKLICKFNLQ